MTATTLLLTASQSALWLGLFYLAHGVKELKKDVEHINAYLESGGNQAKVILDPEKLREALKSHDEKEKDPTHTI